MLHRLLRLLAEEKVTKLSCPHRRRLAFETMESRELLSVSPLGMALQPPLLAPSDAITTATPQAQTLAAAQDSYCNNQLHCFAVEAINDEASEDGSKKLIFKVTLDKAKFPTSQVFTKDIRIITDDPGRFDIVTYMQLEDNEIDGFYDDNIYPVSTCVGYAGLNSYGYYFTDSGSYTHFVHDRDGDRIYAECMMIEITPINDAIPKEDYDFTLEIYNKYYYYSQTPPTPCGSASGTITGDDDDWTVSASINGDDDEALEPCTWIPGNQRTGAFEITREGGTDRNYEITVEFTLGGTATASAAGANPRDYHITKNPNGGDSNAMAKYDSSKGVWWTTMAANEEPLILYVMTDGDHIFEADETVTLTLVDAWGSLNGIGYYDVDGADGNVEILQAPEFLSDADKNNNPNDPTPINGDTYHVTTVEMKSEIGQGGDVTVIDSLEAAHNRPIRYSFSGGGTTSGIFKIDEEDGKISIIGGSQVVAGLFSLSVKAYDAEHTDMYDLATVNISLYVAEIQAGFAGAGPSEVNANNDTMIVGQKVQTQLVITGPGAVNVTSSHWSLSNGKPIKNYTKTLAKGEVIELGEADYDGLGMAYYNTATTGECTTQTVSNTFVFNGKTYTETVTLGIEQPTVERYESQLATYSNGANPVGIRERHLGKGERLMLGGYEGTEFQPGITFLAEVTAPPSSGGEIALTQLVSSRWEIFEKTGTHQEISTDNQYVLDTHTEYNNEIVPVDQILYTNDNPSAKLFDPLKRVIRSDFFQTYLMYRPEGDSIWVSLAVIDWSWAGSATNTPTGWQLVSGATSGGGEGKAEDELPVWNSNFDDLD